MKSKILIVIVICFVLNIIIVNSQISEKSYLDTNSYKDKKFYANSDPKKWNFLDPNFDYSKIPIEKYRDLPYDSPNLDHSRLDPQKYVSAFGCSSCTFRLATAQKLTYSSNGVSHPKTGLAKIPSNYPPNTLFVATKEGIFIILPKTDEKFRLDTSNIGSATVITNNQKVTLSNGITMNGRLSFNDNQAYLEKNNELLLDGIKPKSRNNDILIYFDGKPHQGNYVSYGGKNLIAEGNNIDLEFTTDNKLVKMFPSKDKLQEFAQDDYLSFSIGDSKSKNGKIEFNNRDERNLLTLLRVNKDLETNGYVRMLNDRNGLIIDGSKVTNNYYEGYTGYFARFLGDSTKPHEGAVSMQMVAGNDKEKVYVFDENRRIFVLNNNQKYLHPLSGQPTEKKLLELMDELREKIGKQHNVVLRGFFDVDDLETFESSLSLMKEKLGIDFSKVEDVKGKKIELLEVEKRLSSDSSRAYMFFTSQDPQVFWPAIQKGGDSYRLSAYPYTPGVGSGFGLVHETGHILRSPELDEKFIKTGKEVGIDFGGTQIKFYTRVSGPEELFPSGYSKRNIYEFQAEIFATIVEYPSWFEELTPVEKKRNLAPYEIKKIIEARQAFRDIWLEELEKYKKTK